MKYAMIIVAILLVFACREDDPAPMEIWNPQDHGCPPVEEQPQDEMSCRSRE